MHFPKKLLLSLSLIMIAACASGPLAPKPVTDHPYVSQEAGMHIDHYNTATTDLAMPAADLPVEVQHYSPRLKKSKTNGGTLFPRQCLNWMVDPQGRRVTVGCRVSNFSILDGFYFSIGHFDENYQPVSWYKFTKVNLSRLIKKDLPLNIAYFMMDDQGRVIVAQNGGISFIKVNNSGKVVLDQYFDLSKFVKKDTRLAQAIPDYNGNYWVMGLGKRDVKTRKLDESAVLFYVSSEGEVLDMHRFDGEILENGMSVDSTGVYIVTDFAMYKFAFSDETGITNIFRNEYERATSYKPGVISFEGCGTTPTLHGVNDDLVTITDNADGRVNLLVYNRADGRLICKTPLFKEGISANENSVIAYGDSVIVQNWYNAPHVFEAKKDIRQMEPGLVRIDIRSDRSGSDLIWENYDIKSTSTAKLSTKTGLIYVPTMSEEKDDRGDYLEDRIYQISYIDFETGAEENRITYHKGKKFRQIAMPICAGPDGEMIQPTASGFAVIKNK